MKFKPNRYIARKINIGHADKPVFINISDIILITNERYAKNFLKRENCKYHAPVNPEKPQNCYIVIEMPSGFAVHSTFWSVDKIVKEYEIGKRSWRI